VKVIPWSGLRSIAEGYLETLQDSGVAGVARLVTGNDYQ
jgi:hypothetical protein